ncbi:MAG: DUF721 domain-containing protein [Moraxellaceae bacterium]|nr:DUF721 domain-containing protein [Moraxellaceae bacterium]
MRYQKPVSLSMILGSSQLSPLLRNTLRREHMDAWQSAVDSTLRASCQLASFHDGTLTVCTDNQTTASQLRYLNKIVLQQLQSHSVFASLRKLRVVINTAVQHAPTTTKPPIKQHERLSQNTIKHLKNTAKSLADPELSELLLRLASHGGQTDMKGK